MSVISTKTKGKTGLKAATTALKHPQALLAGTKMAKPASKAGWKASKPVLKRKARRSVEQLDRASRTLGETLAVRAPQAAYELGLAEPPKPKRTVPRVAIGVAIGAVAMYFIESRSR